jgi:8-oxo-dGTP pyrophosphatase MutT (NUDIX family)
MKHRQQTCGCYLLDNRDRLLIAHPTGMDMNIWSIPKGLKDIGEPIYNAAKRELKEETGIDIDDHNHLMAPLGQIEYQNKPKTLHGFMFFLDKTIDDDIVCSSFFNSSEFGIRLPEVDIFQWVNINDALTMIQPEQRRLFNR